MSTISNFKQLELQKKSELIWEWGFYLGNIKTADHNILYFLLNNFFAEMHVRLSDNVTERINAQAELNENILSQLQYKRPIIDSASILNKSVPGKSL